MLGDLFGLTGKIEKAKKEVDEARERLAGIYIEKSTDDHKIHVRISADKTIHEIRIDPAFQSMSMDYLAERLREILNQAMDEATAIQEREVKEALQRVLPGIPGLDKFF